MTREKEFRKELESLINKYSMENRSNTPDYILAQFLSESLRAFDNASALKEEYYSRKLFKKEK